MEYKISPLYDWIEDLIDGTDLHSREDWALLLGTSVQTLGRWVDRELIPPPEELRRMYLVAFSGTGTSFKMLQKRWREMEKKTLLDVAPTHIPEHNAVLGRYVLGTQWAFIREMMSSLSFKKQEDLLIQFTRLVSKAVLDSNPTEIERTVERE
jgi:hypothetical protein